MLAVRSRATLPAQPHVTSRRQRCRAASSEAAELLEAEAEADEEQRQPSGEASEADEAHVSSEDSLGEALSADVAAEVARRRCLAIISHPDAGKSTLTEKLLLYGGAIHEAGEVRARRGSRATTSDWMAIEKERGISISSTAMSFQYRRSGVDMTLNLLDTPGHADFSEDTFRTLSAADNAVMLIDAGKGLEPQTRKLFEVCRLNGLPIFTFCNKLDRPSLTPLELLDEIEREFKMQTYAVNWPVGSGDSFAGVYHRPTAELCLFTKVASGSKEAVIERLALHDPRALARLGAELHAQLVEEVELLDALGGELDLEAVMAGSLTPVFFGSAANNFGVQQLLDSFLDYAALPRAMRLAPAPRAAADAPPEHVLPTDPQFTGFVFKLQANMDPRHRDKVAFLRIVSGEFRRGMKVVHSRTGRTVALSRPQKMFGQERETAETGYAGDVIGLNNPGLFAVGDTVTGLSGPSRSFPLIPSFSPELFATLKNPNMGKYKSFQKGITELLSEGAVQALYSTDEFRTEPILAAVGQLQFEVVQERLRSEYGCDTVLEPLSFTVARWVLGGWPAVEKAGRIFNAQACKDAFGRPVLLFRNQWNVDTLLSECPGIGELSPIGLPPTPAELAVAAMRDRS